MQKEYTFEQISNLVTVNKLERSELKDGSMIIPNSPVKAKFRWALNSIEEYVES